MSGAPEIKLFAATLARDMKAALAAKSRSAVAALEERRYELLARHLGFKPKQPIQPVYVLGDSHVLFFSGDDEQFQLKHRRIGFWRPRYIMRGLDLLPCFHTRHLGPATAWRAFDHDSSTRSREKIEALARHELKPGDRVLLSLGEIDCRGHIPKAVLAGKPVSEAVQETVDRLMRPADWLHARGLRVGIWGPAMVTPKDQLIANHPLPAVGSDKLRIEIVQHFIASLMAASQQRGIGCVCLAGTYHKWAERPPADCYADGFHLSQKLMPSALAALQAADILTVHPATT